MFHMAWNSEEIGTPLLHVAEHLKGKLPPQWMMDLQQEVPIVVEGRTRYLDGVLRLRGPDGVLGEWAIEVKRNLEPRAVRDVIDQVRSLTGGPILIVTPFLSEEARRRLMEQGASYADATGNMRLTLDRPAIFIETEGAKKNPEREVRPLISLKGSGAGRVVRALCDFRPPYGVRELAARAALPTGTTSRVIDLLAREALVERDPKGRVLEADWVRILRRWSQDYHFLKSNRTAQYFEPRGLQTLADKLRTVSVAYSVTGSMASAIHAPVASPRLALVYAEDVMALAQALNLKRVDSNGNVLLIRPSSPLPFERTWKAQGVTYAALSQVAADLMNSPGRGPAEAEALIDWMRGHEDEWRA